MVSNQKKISKILLVILLASAALNVSRYFIIKFQLLSPLIPSGEILLISEPYLFAALINIFASIIALVSYFYSRFLVAIIICFIILGWQFYYLHWGAY